MNPIRYFKALMFLFSTFSIYASDSLNTSQVVDIEGNEYSTVIIGNQIWMRENLRTSTFRNGDTILHVDDNGTWSKLKTGAWCHLYNQNTQCDIYGKLYNYYAVEDSRGLCPLGWRIPTENDFNILTQYLGGEQIAGGKLKDVGTTCWQTPNLGATNESGFSALPGGQRSNKGIFGNLGNAGSWWTITKNNTISAWSISLFSFTGGNAVYKYFNEFNVGLSVRCIKG